MKRILMPATTLTTLKKIAFTLLCCSVLMVFGASAQTAQSVQAIKVDPETTILHLQVQFWTSVERIQRPQQPPQRYLATAMRPTSSTW